MTIEPQDIVGVCNSCGIIEKTDFDRVGGTESIHLRPNYTDNCPLCEKKLRTGASCPHCNFPVHISKQKLRQLNQIFCSNCNEKIRSHLLYSTDLDISERRKLQYEDMKSTLIPKLEKENNLEITESSRFDIRLLLDMESHIPQFIITLCLEEDKLILRWKHD